jgi:hypothetical protein
MRPNEPDHGALVRLHLRERCANRPHGEHQGDQDQQDSQHVLFPPLAA